MNFPEDMQIKIRDLMKENNIIKFRRADYPINCYAVVCSYGHISVVTHDYLFIDIYRGMSCDWCTED
jgi:hypothetical protein